MKRTRLVSISLALILSCALMTPAAIAGPRGWPHHSYRHSHHHAGGFWPGLAIGMGAAVLGSSIYHHYNSPRYVYVEPVDPCLDDRPYPPCRRYAPDAPYDDRGRRPESWEPRPGEMEDAPDTVDETAEADDRTAAEGHYHTETYWRDGYYDPEGQWVEGGYVERSRQWVQTAPVDDGTGGGR